jgi:hypothetical protein
MPVSAPQCRAQFSPSEQTGQRAPGITEGLEWGAKTRRSKHTYEVQDLYRRDRVLAVAQSTEGRAAKRRWD